MNTALRILTILAAALLTASIGWSVARAEPVHLELLAPPLAPELLRARTALPPPQDWMQARPGLTCPRPAEVSIGKVNLNRATEEELRRLPGVGPAKARAIVLDRARRGRFRRILDLRRVRGFGRKSVARLSPHLSVSD